MKQILIIDGQGDLGADEQSDFSVECRSCSRSTRAYIKKEDAIAAWNKGELIE